MSEEFEALEQFDNHIEPEQVQETPQEDHIETPQQTEEALPQAFKVKYNKEEMEIPYEQAPDYIQKGLNYDKVQGKLSTYETQLERIARITGYSNPDEMLSSLDEIERQREEERYAELGLDKETFESFMAEHPDIQFARQIRAEKEQEARLTQEGNELFAEFPDLKVEDIPKEAWALREERGVSLLDAYLRVNYKNISQQKEQEVIKKLQNNSKTSVGALDREGVNHNVGYSSMSAAEKKALRERVLRGETVQF